VIQASDVRFVEAETLGECQVGNQDLEVLRSCIPDGILVGDDPSTPMEDVIKVIPHASCQEAAIPSNSPVAIQSSRPCSTGSKTLPEGWETAVTTGVSDLRPGNPRPQVLHRSGRHGYLAQAHKAMLEPGASTEAESDPLSYWEALNHNCYANWKDAMGAEFHSLIENKTCTYCSKVPDSAQPIGCKWVYLLKTNPDGSRRFKARLVIKEYEQTDIGETFAPVAK